MRLLFGRVEWGPLLRCRQRQDRWQQGDSYHLNGAARKAFSSHQKIGWGEKNIKREKPVSPICLLVNLLGFPPKPNLPEKCKVFICCSTHRESHVQSLSLSFFGLFQEFFVILSDGRLKLRMMRNGCRTGRDWLGLGIIHFLLYTLNTCCKNAVKRTREAKKTAEKEKKKSLKNRRGRLHEALRP